MWRTVTLSVKEEHIEAPSPLAGVDALDAEYWGDIDLNVDGSDTVGDADDENKGYESTV